MARQRGHSRHGSRSRKLLLQLIELLADDPWRSPPPFEALIGDLRGAYSRRINLQHRLVYSVETDQQLVKVLRLWSHYD